MAPIWYINLIQDNKQQVCPFKYPFGKISLFTELVWSMQGLIGDISLKHAPFPNLG